VANTQSSKPRNPPRPLHPNQHRSMNMGKPPPQFHCVTLQRLLRPALSKRIGEVWKIYSTDMLRTFGKRTPAELTIGSRANERYPDHVPHAEVNVVVIGSKENLMARNNELLSQLPKALCFGPPLLLIRPGLSLSV
jgi:hypothetical protein